MGSLSQDCDRLPIIHDKRACEKMRNHETVSSFVYTLKTDIRFVNSYKWAEPIFRILPISALYGSF